MGRPKKNIQVAAVRVPSPIMNRVDAWASKAGKMNRSEALRTLIETGLDAKEGPKGQLPAWAARIEAAANQRQSTPEALATVLIDGLVDDEPDKPKPRRGLKLTSWLA